MGVVLPTPIQHGQSAAEGVSATMLFRDRTTGGYVTLQEAQANFPNVAFGTPLSTTDFTTLGIDPIYPTTRPIPNPTQQVVLAPPTQDTAGNWHEAYTVVDLTVGMSQTQLTTLKQSIATQLAAGLNAQKNAIIAGGYQYDFSAYMTDKGVAVSTITINAAGVLTLQLDSDSQRNWIALFLQALQLINASHGTTQLTMRTTENYNVLVPATDVISILTATMQWVSTQIFTAAGLKDQANAAVANTAISPQTMLTYTWPTQ